MPRFNGLPPNGDSRKAIQQRAREATRPAEPEKKGSWPFCANKCIIGAGPAASSGQAKKPD